ncbi:DNA phosphorothioation-dependent restriction protein DptG [Aliivibrio fischeri]|uniref:DNA phosphorothioation-dependent restriction protein DptG n=1 Tax=Aliivibrio fischeri TaxID=668 RepID=UPI001F2437B2|nr:DNA phosphorothioation-dependent restriction protein DptG [Aliivibrio fischeri]MCE7577310.1 DNA phosphorothioation-dependent restriction protein DptG [Aliivibrio fischeri]MCE7589599.1 DNA phosphorothioation-dependent restriction protein DptG [Aliivibrio fischeri]
MNQDKFKEVLNPNLPQSEDSVSGSNSSLKSYFPLVTNKNNKFTDDKAVNNVVVGSILKTILRKEIRSYDYDQFTLDCKSQFISKLGEEDFWDILEEMYFSEKHIFSVSPEFLLFYTQDNQNKATDPRMVAMFSTLLGGMRIGNVDAKLNFLESEMLSVFRTNMHDATSVSSNIKPYLPFLSKVFRADLAFLSSRPQYMLNELESFLSFYAFTYTAQLSLSLQDWHSGEEPTAKPLYFIMDHERASSERTHIKKHGFRLFSDSASKLFPMLSMLVLLQPNKNTEIPLWELSKNIHESEYEHLTERLKNFAYAFKAKRKLKTTLEDSDLAIDWLANIMKLAMAQFDVGDRLKINKEYVTEIEKYLASHFIQSRGRSGRVLVLNQDYIILLTNLVVGEKDKLRFHELITAFEQRGIFVDKQTEQELIKFYERIGNVERMSDSGDAVYVRKTI